MSKGLIAVAVAGACLLPLTAQAQSRVAIPNVELFATVSGKWVLDPRKCRDIREDIRDARVTKGRRDRREDRRDQRVADCPASAYTFVVDAGQGPKFPVRVGRGRVDRKYRGQPMFINGDTIGPNGRPLETPGQAYAPVRRPFYQPQPVQEPRVYQQPVQQYQAPTSYQQQPVQQYQAPTSYQPQPVQQYQQPVQQVQPQTTYQQPTQQYQPVQQYQPAQPPAAPSEPSNYRIINGVIVFD